MRLNLIAASILSLSCSTLSYAFFCPNNFKQINYGDTMDTVIKQCGQPDEQKSEEASQPVAQEWNYYMNQQQSPFIPQNTLGNAPQGTMKTTFTFDNTGKLINMSVNGVGVGASTICGPNIQLGDSIDTVKAACGQATMVNKQNPADLGNQKPPDKKVTFFYKKTNPRATLTFVNGLLKESK